MKLPSFFERPLSFPALAFQALLGGAVIGGVGLSGTATAAVVLNDTDRVSWAEGGIDTSSGSASSLSEISSGVAAPDNIKTILQKVKDAVAAYAKTPSGENQSALENAVSRYNTEITKYQGADTSANGIPTLVFDSDTVLAAVTGKSDQRLNIGTKTLSANIARDATLTISGNTTGSAGGALYVGSGGVFVQNGKGRIVFSENATGVGGSSGGGAVYNAGTVVLGDGAEFERNKATVRDGAAMYNTSAGTVRIGSDAVFAGNVAKVNGGAVYNEGYFSLGSGALFSSNEGSWGGAIYNAGVFGLGSNSVFSGNSANYGGAAYIRTGGLLTVSSGAEFSSNTASVYGGALYSNGTLNLVTAAGNTATRFYQNQDSVGSNSVYLWLGSLNVSGDGVLDMLDPMRRVDNTNSIAVNQTGGTWYLAGANDFAASRTDNTKFSITGGGLYLYGEGEESRSGAGDEAGKVLAASLGTISLGGAASSFTLGSSATLTAGGMGNAVTAKNGTITLENNATLGFNLAGYDNSSSSAMLALTAASVATGENFNINLASMAGGSGDFKLLTVSNDGVLDEDKITLTAAGQVIGDVDFLEGVESRIDGNDYWVSVGGYTWNSILADSADHKNLAHGTFTVSDGEFAIEDAFADRTDITAPDNAYGWDGTTLTKKGAGKLILNGINTYTGLTTVSDGTLIIGGDTAHSTAQVSGDVIVENGAVFGGHGTVFGDVLLQSGAAVSPGNSIGTLTVGSITFGSGSTALFEVAADGTADKIIADMANGGTGTATIESDAGLVLNSSGSGTWADDTTYVLVDAQGGVTGTFDNITNNLAFLDYSVNYNPTQVLLNLTRNSTNFEDIGNTFNQRQTGSGIGSLTKDHAVYKAIVGLGRDEALRAYDNLSGEIYGSARSALLTNSRYLRDAVNRRLLPEPEALPHQPVWAAAWGYNGRTQEDGNAAKIRNRGGGVVFGADGEPAENIVGGFVLGYERISVEAGARSSTADIDAFHFGAYAATRFRSVKLRGGMAYSYLDGRVRRDIRVSGLEGTAKSSPNGQQFQIFAEASKDFKWADTAVFSPYANVAHVWLDLGHAKENGSSAALDVDGGADNITFVTLGMRGELHLPAAKNMSLYGNLGWQHASGDTDGKTVNRFKDAGSSFLIKGIGVDRNVGLIGIGINMAVTENSSLTVGYQGEIGSDTANHSANLMWKTRF